MSSCAAIFENRNFSQILTNLKSMKKHRSTGQVKKDIEEK